MKKDTHKLFKSKSHDHIAELANDEFLSLMIVETREGKWFIEQESEFDDFSNFDSVVNPWNFKEPTFFDSEDQVRKIVKEVFEKLKESH